MAVGGSPLLLMQLLTLSQQNNIRIDLRLCGAKGYVTSLLLLVFTPSSDWVLLNSVKWVHVVMKLPFLMFLSKLWTDSCSVDHASFFFVSWNYWRTKSWLTRRCVLLGRWVEIGSGQTKSDHSPNLGLTALGFASASIFLPCVSV